MQPFDALTIRAVLQEAKPLLLNRKVDKVYQLGRDEIVLLLRSKAGPINLLMSAQTAYGRICLVKTPAQPASFEKSGRGGANSQSNFCMLLRKHFTGATLVGVEQPVGERMVDFIFSCVDEVGGASLKILTTEIMSRHSNLIFWDKASEKIICASHVVTKEMSRQREVAPGLKFVRPPGQDKINIFSAGEEELAGKLSALNAAVQAGEPLTPPLAPTLEQWLINSYTGLGRHLAAELVAAAGAPSGSAQALSSPDLKDRLWQRISALRDVNNFAPALKTDLSTYSVVSWWPDMDESPEWKKFPSANDMVDEYYSLVEAREQFNQLRERLRSELRGESEKLTVRISAASAQIGNGGSLEQLKRNGDLVLANLNRIEPGQEELVCDDLYDGETSAVTIKLNPNISPAQNAQTFYRMFAKSRARHNAANTACREASQRLDQIKAQMQQVEGATDSNQLRQLKDALIGRKPQEALKQPQQQKQAPKKNKSRLLSLTSSDGWTVYVGRNRQENDFLLSRLAQPNDLWFHIQGQGGAHVLIRVPASKQEPPLNTIREAAQVAARLSKAAAGSKQRVVYTQCKYVKKVSKEKPGVVRYENERTIEIDTGVPMPKCMKQLFQQQER
ncbi:MAG TPA: NFACT RNA binding domain-containing protein [Planktothrix sp.]|jgi:predicted ribosome quality control (RQC) complex YloA/Tae2 family protein